MRALAMVVLCLSIPLALATLSIMHVLANFGASPLVDEALVEPVLRGRLHELYLAPRIWSGIAAATAQDLAQLLTWRAFGAVALLGAWIAAVGRSWFRRRPAALGLALLLAAALPWTVGVVMLGWNGDPTRVGPWLTLMVGSVFWSAAASTVVALAELLRPDRPWASVPRVVPGRE
jgi:hypothetical protein